jgi:hypothetical protein
MKKLILIVALLATATAYGSARFFDSSDVMLGIFTDFKCSTGLTCTETGGQMVVSSSPTLVSALVLGDGTAADFELNYDGNAQDYNISLDDSSDDLVIGLGVVPGTTDAIRVDENQDVTIVQNLLPLSAVGIGAAATFTDSDATPDVSDGSNFETNTSAVTITDFDGAGIFEGQLLYVVSKGAITYDVTSSGIVGGSTDIITAAGDVTVFFYDGADWLVSSRIDLSDDLN